MKSTPRIQISSKEATTHIEINPVRDPLKTNLLVAWLIVWTICGIIVFSQFFSNMSREEKLLMAVWMAFWAYFEFKIGTAYLWRKSGVEHLSIDSEKLVYSRIVSGKAETKSYVTDTISNLAVYEFGKNSFSDSFQSSYWVKGNECVFFEYFGQKIGMGLQLNKEEATQLHKAIQKALKTKK